MEVSLEEERGALERCQSELTVRQSRVAWLEQEQADDLGDRYHWRQGLEALPCWKSKTAKHATKRKTARSKSKLGPSETKKTQIYVLPQEKAVPDQGTVKLVDYSEDEETSRRVVFLSKSERSKLLAEGSGLAPATPELDSTMGVGSLIDLSKEDSNNEDKSRQVLLISKGERSKLLAEGSGSTPNEIRLEENL